MGIITPSRLAQSRKMFDCWEDLRFPAQAVGPGATAPNWDSTYLGYKFVHNAGANEEVQGVAQLPHRWREGSSIHAHIHWILTVNGAANEDVKWDLLYRWVNIGGTFGAWTTLEVTVDVSSYSANDHLYSEWALIAGAGFTISSILDWRIQRDTADAADDHPQDVVLKEFDIHYQADAFGSWGEYNKWD